MGWTEVYLIWLQTGVTFSAEYVEKMEPDRYKCFLAAGQVFNAQKQAELKTAILEALVPDECTIRSMQAQQRYLDYFGG